MKKNFIGIFYFLLCIVGAIFSLSCYAQSETSSTHQFTPSIAPMLQKVMPAVVNISAQGEMQVYPSHIPRKQDNDNPLTPPRGPETRDFESLGSGVIVDANKGYIITNAHVISEAKTITITLNDGRRYKAKLIGSDPASDVAVIQIEADKLTAIQLGDSDTLKVGDFVAAIGNPFNLNQTVTSGIISGLQRSDLGIEGYENFIQTDASINRGNSGGALVDINGKLIGINTAILAPSGGSIGISFAIPINMAQSVMQQLIKYGSVHRGLIGIMTQNFTPDLANAFKMPDINGAIVTLIIPDSPAAKAGFKAGDVILKVNNKSIKDSSAVRNTIGLLRVGDPVTVSLLRNGKPLTLSMQTDDPKQYQKQTEANNPFLWGLAMQNFDEQIPSQGHVKGIQILQVAKNSAAWRAGLRPGDVIVSANQIAVTNLDELKTAAKNDHEQLIVNIMRDDGSAMFVVIK